MGDYTRELLSPASFGAIALRHSVDEDGEGRDFLGVFCLYASLSKCLRHLED